MIRSTRLLLGLVATAVSFAVTCQTALLAQQTPDWPTYSFQDYKNGSNEGIAGGELAARRLVAHPDARGRQAVLGSDYFLKLVKQERVVNGGKLVAYAEGGKIAAIIIALEMKKLEREGAFLAAAKTEQEILKAWETRRSEWLSILVQGSDPVLDADYREVWKQLLDQWTNDAVASRKFKDAFSEAPYELVRAIFGFLDNAPAPSAKGNSSDGVASNAGPQGSGFPFHERRMNHIYHHNDRQVARAQRIRARR